MPDEYIGRARLGAFMQGIDYFDHHTFAISRAEASCMDPQQRLLLEHDCTALHGAGFERSSLLGSDTGVYLGITSTEFAQYPTQQSAYIGSVGHCFAAGRLSFVLGLQGPCIAFDTACSSSLVAFHAALRALQSNECTLAVVSGVYAMLIPTVAVRYAQAGMTSISGRSRTFDKRADGFGRGEACAATILQCLATSDVSVAEAAVRQDGKSASLTAPNGQMQRALIQAACKGAGATSIGCVEAHGTGTKLGDPTEVGAIAAALARDCNHAINICSAKANMGHAEPAAGIVGLLKLAHAIIHEQVAPNAQLRVLNPMLAEAHGDALEFSTQLSAIAPSKYSGVSSFGLGGTIAHVVLQRCDAEGAVHSGAL